MYSPSPSTVSLVLSELNVATKPSSLRDEAVEDAEPLRLKDGRGLRLGLCCAADAKYDAGLNDRLAMLICSIINESCLV
jgi:hypothetical protein